MTSKSSSEGFFRFDIIHVPSVNSTHRDAECSTEADGLRVILLGPLRGVGGGAGGHLSYSCAVQKRLPLGSLLPSQSKITRSSGTQKIVTKTQALTQRQTLGKRK